MLMMGGADNEDTVCDELADEEVLVLEYAGGVVVLLEDEIEREAGASGVDELTRDVEDDDEVVELVEVIDAVVEYAGGPETVLEEDVEKEDELGKLDELNDDDVLVDKLDEMMMLELIDVDDERVG